MLNETDTLSIFLLSSGDHYITYNPVSDDYSTVSSIRELHFWDWQFDHSVFSEKEKQLFELRKASNDEHKTLINMKY